MLYLIGIGLGNELDITLRGLEAVKKCNFIYLESYTSKINARKPEFEKLYGREIILADRNMVENKASEIIKRAKVKDVAFLVIGDALSATTHISLLMQAKEESVETEVIHNASILNAVSDTGLSLYKFGKTASIPFQNNDIETPYVLLKENLSINAHTLFLLDLIPMEDVFMTVNEAIEYLLRTETKKKLNLFSKSTMVVACCGFGSEDSVIKYGKAAEIASEEFTKFPQCLIVPSKLHFMEEDYLKIISKD